MCGIVGYIGRGDATTIALDCLTKLEYRGYDSAGIAVLNSQGIEVRKRPGKITELKDLVGRRPLHGHAAVCHSRWATHGQPSEINAHPHTDCTGRIALVHNGIIENYARLKQQLLKRGHAFRSQTDTEVITHLVEELAKRHGLAEAFRLALRQLKGSYAICLLSAGAPDRLFGARQSSPLIVGLGRGEAMFASDVPAVLGRTRRVVYLKDGDVVELTAGGPRVTTLAGRVSRPRATTVTWDVEAAKKGGYAHFMLKEIHEQPQAIRQTLANRLRPDAGTVRFDRRTEAFLARLGSDEQFVIIACGTAYHAGLVGEYMLEELARIPVDVDVASEFRYRAPMLDRKTTVLAITQSGETADTLAGIRLAREQGVKTLAICNVVGSSLAREVDAVIYTHAGPEIAVASTKAYTAQLTALLLLTLSLAQRRRTIPQVRRRELVRALARLPADVQRALRCEEVVKRTAATYAKARNFYYLGRRHHYPSALEGALKLKEVCPLVHAEGYAAGEMKHGPISLIKPGWPVVFLATRSSVYEKTVSNIEEVRARRGECLVIASEGDARIARHSDALIRVPRTEEPLSPIVAAIPLQLFAYHMAVANGCDVDQPPNLAKSVTVE